MEEIKQDVSWWYFLLIVVFLGGFFMFYSWTFPAKNKDAVWLTPENERLIVLAKVSHLERSLEILKFAREKIGSDYASEEAIVYLINVEWNRLRGSAANVAVESGIGGEREGIFNTDPRNSSDKKKLSESINELEKRIRVLNNHLKINSATEEITKK